MFFGFVKEEETLKGEKKIEEAEDFEDPCLALPSLQEHHEIQEDLKNVSFLHSIAREGMEMHTSQSVRNLQLEIPFAERIFDSTEMHHKYSEANAVRQHEKNLRLFETHHPQLYNTVLQRENTVQH